MALILARSFESNSFLELDGFQMYVSFGTAKYRTGTRSLQLTGAGGVWQSVAFFNLPSRSELYMQFAFNFSPASVSAPLIKLFDYQSATVLATVTCEADGRLRFYLGDSAQSLGYSNMVIPDQLWFVLQIRLKVSDTDGAFVARINSDFVFEYNGDTKIGAESNINRIGVAAVTNQTVYLDDMIVHDTFGNKNNSWPNGARVYVIRPNGAGQYTEWSPSSGSNWDCLDETPPSMADYVRPTDVDQRDLYNLQDLNIQDFVGSVILEYWGELIGNPPINAIKPLIRLDGVDYEGSTLQLSPSFGPRQVIYETAPDGSPWTLAKVNNMQVGMKSATV